MSSSPVPDTARPPARIRAFLAVDLDADTKARVGRWVTDLSMRLGLVHAEHVRWIDPDRLHLTVHFFGAIESSLIPEILSALEPPWAPPFTLRLAGAGTFPLQAAPRVIWLGATMGADSLVALRDEVERRLGARGFAVDPRPKFTPHLTIGRVRPHAPRSFETTLRAVLSASRFEASCAIGALTLFESRLSPRGAAYVPLATCALASPR